MNIYDKLRQEIINRRRGIWKCYGREYAVIPLCEDEAARIRCLLRMLLGAPDRIGSFGGRIWLSAGIMISENPPQVQTVGQVSTPRTMKIMETVFEVLEKGAPDGHLSSH